MIAEKIIAKINETKTHHTTKTGLKEIAAEVADLEARMQMIPAAVARAVKEEEESLSDGFNYYNKEDETLCRIGERVINILSNAIFTESSPKKDD